VRTIAAIPAAALISGAAAGLFVPEAPRLPLCAFLIGGGALSWWAWHVADARLLTIAVMSAFFAGGTLLSADAWQRAWRPPLWTMFEALAREQRQEAEATGRRLPLDDEAFAVVRGRLRADAAPQPPAVRGRVDLADGRAQRLGRGVEQPVDRSALARDDRQEVAAALTRRQIAEDGVRLRQHDVAVEQHDATLAARIRYPVKAPGVGIGGEATRIRLLLR
jgi:hypothetical protein